MCIIWKRDERGAEKEMEWGEMWPILSIWSIKWSQMVLNENENTLIFFFFCDLLCCWEKNYKNELSSLLLWQPQRQYLWAHKCINIWRFLECARCLFQSMAKIHLETKQNSHHFIEIYASLKYPVIHVSVWWICLLPFCCYREDASHWCSFTFQAKLSISTSHAEKESDIQLHFKSNTNIRR